MLVLTWGKMKLYESELSSLHIWITPPSYPLGLMLDAVHSCKYPQVVMQGVFFCGISTTNSCLCKYSLYQMAVEKKGIFLINIRTQWNW